MINTENPKVSELLNGQWKNKYLCKLALLDHLRECFEKDNYIKAIDASKEGVEAKNLDKELMDLKIILDMYFETSDELYQTRLDKFLANMAKNLHK